jgi:2,4-dienoyl-CoA reductase-like NADH-dependent reductase (Old Yellow Enzyme family)
MAEPFAIKGLRLKNRLIRSSIGGKFGYYDGSPTDAWTHFEKRFARTGVAALISATLSVDDTRYSPLEYAKLADDRFIAPFANAIARIKQGSDCHYILQIGDPGAHTQTSLFSKAAGAQSSSATFDLLYGYRNHSTAMSHDRIAHEVRQFANAARRARQAGADGVEVTLSKGYLVHQFLNPGVNRRDDAYGGSKEKRFRFAREVVTAVRAAVGPDFPFGVRLSAADHNYLPVNLRLPPTFPLRGWVLGNGLEETTWFARELEQLGVDWLHLTRGFGFINPKESPGDLPVPELRRVYNAGRHLGAKAAFRASVMNLLPDWLVRSTLGVGWRKGKELGASGRIAGEFRRVVKIPIIANGGFQSRALIEDTLRSGNCDLVSFARPLLANPDLLAQLHHRDEPEVPCTFCNRCSMLTAVVPVGCYDPSRFPDQEAMEAQILERTVDPDLSEGHLTADEPANGAAVPAP